MAKQQEWWLARDGRDKGGRYVFSQLPLHDCGTDDISQRDWIAAVTRRRRRLPGMAYGVVGPETFNILTQGKYELEPGAEPRKVVFDPPLGVKEKKS